MSIKQNGGVFGRNPTFNDVTIEGDLIINGEVFTGLDFQGSWNASTNSPTLASSVGTNGEFYIVSVAGTTNLNGITNWGIGDWAIFNGTVWQRVEGGADGNFNDVTVAGTLGVTGEITANGGIDVTGDVVNSGGFYSTVNNSLKIISGGDASNAGSNLTLYGGTNASAGTFRFRNGTATHLEVAGNGDISFYEDTGTTAKLFWDASAERLGIGTSSPTAPLTIGYSGAEAQLLINNSGDSRMVYLGAFSANEGMLRLFNSSNVETVRIPAESTTGVHTYFNAGKVGIGTSSPASLLTTNVTADGAIHTFSKSGTTVGSIGVISGDNLFITGAVANHSGVAFSQNSVLPMNGSSYATETVDLGSSGFRFKDLYLSSGVVFGTTGGSVTSKTLDDYEEGTWTPTLFGSGSSATTLLTALGRYVKVGKSVTCWVEISCDGSTTLPTGNYISLAGLPFNPVASRTFAAVVSVTGLTGLTAGTYFVGITNSGTTVNLNKMNQDGVIGAVGLTAASLTSTFQAAASITYEVS
jgi:hypothetical protein